GRKRNAVVECNTKRRRVRLDQNIGNRGFPLQIRTLAGMPRIFVAANVEPGPAVERTLAHPGDVVRHQLVSHAVTLVGRAIDVAGCGMNRETYAIADTGGKHASAFPIGVEHQYISAVGLAPPACAERMLA